jgi:hypothetical protein
VNSVSDSIFLQIFNSIGSGKRIAVLISAFFDESTDGDANNGLLAVCGYALDKDGLEKFTPEWQAMNALYHVPYFHMAECNSNCDKFAHLSLEECDKCAREAIRLARTYPLHGHCYVLDQSEYREILQDQGFDCDPYTFMVWSAFVHVNNWVGKNKPDHQISLFFENGYKTEPRSGELLGAFSKENWGGKNKVVSHAFVRKEFSEPAQAGDLIAWHVRKSYQNMREGKPIRADSKALFKDRENWTINWTPERLRSIKKDFINLCGSLDNASKRLFDPANLQALS